MYCIRHNCQEHVTVRDIDREQSLASQPTATAQTLQQECNVRPTQTKTVEAMMNVTKMHLNFSHVLVRSLKDDSTHKISFQISFLVA